MPGIFGVVSREPGAAETLDRMASRMRHHPWYVEQKRQLADHTVCLGRMGLSPTHFGGIAESPGSEVVVVLDGELSEPESLRQQLQREGRQVSSNQAAEILLHGYQSHGLDFFRQLNGKFIAAIWDGKNRKFLLLGDRFGMRPLYYSAQPGKLLFSAEIKSLLLDSSVSRKLYLPAVSQFFHYGQIIDESTFYDGIRLIPAGSFLQCDLDGNSSVEPYWRLADVPTTLPGSRLEILDRISDAFQNAVLRSTGGDAKLGLSLSGGLDARTILGCAPDDRAMTTLCLGMAGSMDLSSAKKMADLVNRPHKEVFLDERFLANFGEHLHHMVRLTDGHYVCQCIVMPTLPVYRELGIEALLRGHAGELLHMTKAYNFSLDGEAQTLADDAAVEGWLWRRLQAYILDGTDGKLFAPAYRGQMEELARETLRSRQRPFLGLTPPVQQIARLFLDIRLRRETALSLVEFGSLVETRLPYLDNDLIDLVLSAPMELKLDDVIQKHILQKRRPSFLKVTNVNTGAPMTAGRLGRLFGKVRQKVFAKLGVKGYQPYERLGLWLRRELRPLVEGLLLSPRCLDRGLFDAQEVRNVVRRHLDNTANHTFLILALMIFEVGQREFIDQDTAERPLVLAS